MSVTDHDFPSSLASSETYVDSSPAYEIVAEQLAEADEVRGSLSTEIMAARWKLTEPR
jgi:hypothetical protein